MLDFSFECSQFSCLWSDVFMNTKYIGSNNISILSTIITNSINTSMGKPENEWKS